MKDEDMTGYDVEAARAALGGSADNASSGERAARAARRVMAFLAAEVSLDMRAVFADDRLSLYESDDSAPVVVTFRQEEHSFTVIREGRQGWILPVEFRDGILKSVGNTDDALVAVSHTIKRMFGPVENFSAVTLVP